MRRLRTSFVQNYNRKKTIKMSMLHIIPNTGPRMSGMWHAEDQLKLRAEIEKALKLTSWENKDNIYRRTPNIQTLMDFGEAVDALETAVNIMQNHPQLMKNRKWLNPTELPYKLLRVQELLKEDENMLNFTWEEYKKHMKRLAGEAKEEERPQETPPPTSAVSYE